MTGNDENIFFANKAKKKFYNIYMFLDIFLLVAFANLKGFKVL